jgi:hypothetical protein
MGFCGDDAMSRWVERQRAISMLLTIGVLLGCVVPGIIIPYLFFWLAVKRIDFGPDGYFLIFMVWMISIPLGFIVGLRLSRGFWRSSFQVK